MPVVFISHNKANKDVAREMALFLAAENINVWFDEWEISVGDSITEKIDTGLLGCTHFIIIWSKNSAKSNWVNREFQSVLIKAIKSNIPRIIPILLDDTSLPSLIADIRYLRYKGGLEEDRYEIINAITGNKPSQNFIKAVVKKYNEVIYDVETEGPFCNIACPVCGSQNLNNEMATDYAHDEIYYITTCKECNWSDWTQ